MFANFVEFIDCSENSITLSIISQAHGFKHAVQNLAIIDADQIIPAWNAHGFQCIRQHRANFRIRRDRSRSNRIRIALIKLAIAARARFFVAPHWAHRITTIGRRQIIAVLRINTRQRSRQIIAKGDPIAIFFLPCKDPFVRAINIWQKLTQSLNGFDGATVQRVKSIPMVNTRDFFEHFCTFCHLRTEIVTKPFGRFSLGARCFFDFGHNSQSVRNSVRRRLSHGRKMSK